MKVSDVLTGAHKDTAACVGLLALMLATRRMSLSGIVFVVETLRNVADHLEAMATREH